MGKRVLRHPEAVQSALEAKPRPTPHPLVETWHIHLTRRDGQKSDYRGKVYSKAEAEARVRELWERDPVYDGAWIRLVWELAK